MSSAVFAILAPYMGEAIVYAMFFGLVSRVGNMLYRAVAGKEDWI